MQTRRHGGHTGAVPPQLAACAPLNETCAPPSEDCTPKKLTGLGLLERKSRHKLVYFVDWVDWHRILRRFWDKDLFFFWRSPVFGRKNRLIFRFRLENPLKFSSSPCSFDPEWDTFLVPPVPLSNSHKINFSCPAKIYFCPPSHAILAPGLAWCPSWSTPGKSEQLPLAVRWPEQPPTLQPKTARVNDAQSWTALFRALSFINSFHSLSTYLTKGISQLDKPLGQTGQTLRACTVAEAF